jgi:hypothetical protein
VVAAGPWLLGAGVLGTAVVALPVPCAVVAIGPWLLGAGIFGTAVGGTGISGPGGISGGPSLLRQMLGHVLLGVIGLLPS